MAMRSVVSVANRSKTRAGPRPGASTELGGWRRRFGRAAAGVLGVVALFAGVSAHASTTFVVSPDFDPVTGVWQIQDPWDYTVPSDGQLYRWDFSFTSADPNATLFLDPPNLLNAFDIYETSTGPSIQFIGDPIYTFDESEGPGLLTIFVQNQASYDNCTPGVISTSACGAIYQVFGDGTRFTGTSFDPLTVTWTITAVPEPAEWTLMLVGMGVLGAGLRRRRRHGDGALAMAATDV